MANFDYRKFLKENKSTFHSSLADNYNLHNRKLVITITADVAEKFAKYMSEKEGKNFTVTPNSVDEYSFDLDVDGEKYAGGSYLIKNSNIINAAVPGNPVYAKVNQFLEETTEKKQNKMKKSELKAKIKEMVLAEYEKDVNITNTNPEKEVDFLAELENMLNEADKIEKDMDHIIAFMYMHIDNFFEKNNNRSEDELEVIDDIKYDLEGRRKDTIFKKYEDINSVEDLEKYVADNLGKIDDEEDIDEMLARLSEADDTEKDTAETDSADVTVDDTETVDVETTAEVDPDVKAVQDALTQAQAAAQKLGDKKLTDQIGNTITFFTRAHVVEKPGGAVAEELNEMAGKTLEITKSEDLKKVEGSQIFKYDVFDKEDFVNYKVYILADDKAQAEKIAKEKFPKQFPPYTLDAGYPQKSNTADNLWIGKEKDSFWYGVEKPKSGAVAEGKESLNEDLASALTALIITIIAIPAIPITGALLMGLIDYLFNDLPEQRAEAKELRLYKGPDKQEKVLALAKEIESKLSPGKKKYLKTLVNRVGAAKLEDKAKEYRELDRYAQSQKLDENLTTDIKAALKDLPIPSNEMEEGKKRYYKDAEADDAEHIKALEKDMKDDKKSSMNEEMFPLLKRILK